LGERAGHSNSYDLPEPGKAQGGNNVRALLYPDDLAKHCRKIEREAVLAIEETGANMLSWCWAFWIFPIREIATRFIPRLCSVSPSL
jgi:Protein of unknown function (DUF4011)